MSDIDYSNLPSVTARDLVSALLRDGFEFKRKSGSHERYAHEDGRRVTIPDTPYSVNDKYGELKSY